MSGQHGSRAVRRMAGNQRSNFVFMVRSEKSVVIVACDIVIDSSTRRFWLCRQFAVLLGNRYIHKVALSGKGKPSGCTVLNLSQQGVVNGKWEGKESLTRVSCSCILLRRSCNCLCFVTITMATDLPTQLDDCNNYEITCYYNRCICGGQRCLHR